MAPSSTIPLGKLLLLALLLLTAACRSPVQENPAAGPGAVSLLDQQLFDIIEKEAELDAIAAEPDVAYSEVQRHFQQVARDYNSLMARNPRHLETRLLYGKLLSRYGDNEGAREQFLIAASIDPNIAVIHQQLCTYYAEQEDFTRALAYALNAIRLEPETAAYHFALGQVLAVFRDEFLKEAIFTPEKLDADLLAAFATAKDLEPDTLSLQFRYGEAFYDVGNPDWESALNHWESLFEVPSLSPLQKDAIRLHQARCLIEIGRPEEARQMAESVQTDQLIDSAKVLF